MSHLAIVEEASLSTQGLVEQVRNLGDADALRDVKAKIEAARAWAKVHGKAREVRLDLLRVEITALARIAELGHLDVLPKREHEAAKYFAGLAEHELDTLIRDAGPSITTASGLHGTLKRIARLERELAESRARGRRFAEDPDLEARIDREEPVGIAAAIQQAIRTYTETGKPFTVEDFADDVLSDAEVTEDDPAIAQGAREVCRAAIRRAPVLTIGGTTLPRTITASVDGQYVRIPTENALLGHLDDMRAMRREQLAQDEAALARLDSMAEELWSMPGASERSRIGGLIADSLRDGAA